jgi:thioredoxin 1
MTVETSSDADAAPASEPYAVDGDADLESFVTSNDVVLVDFYADWCGPCKMLAPIVERLAAETEAGIAKVDVDANQSLAAEYGVQGVPTLVLFVNGEQEQKMVGVQSEDQLRSLIAQYT